MLTKLVAEFRNEGFITSLLSKEDNIWGIAMDDMELSFRRRGRYICVACTPAEEAIVMTAWMEVASQMNDLARAISKPVRSEDVGKLLKSGSGDKHAAVRAGVARYLQGFVMLPNFRADSKEGAIAAIVDEIAKACPNHVRDAAKATAAVMKREESMPTGLDHGIAVPHGRDASVTGIAGAVAVLAPDASIADYETIDARAVRIIVLTLANDQDQNPYLQLMAHIAKTLRNKDGYLQLAKCQTAEEMRRFFRS